MNYLLPLLILLASPAAAQTLNSGRELYLGDPATELYYSSRCDEARRMVRRWEFSSREAAEARGFKPGECTITRPDRHAESLYDALRGRGPGGSAGAGSDPAGAQAERLAGWSGDCSGEVIGVTDGDTVIILNGAGKHVRVRLSGIDAPETGQAFGDAATSQLSGLTLGRRVRCEAKKADALGRAVGRLRLDGADVNLLMVRTCLAWYYPAHGAELSGAERTAYARAEAFARSGRCGIFQDADPTEPWAHRRSGTPNPPGIGGGVIPALSPGRPRVTTVPVRSHTRGDATRARSQKRSRLRN